MTEEALSPEEQERLNRQLQVIVTSSRRVIWALIATMGILLVAMAVLQGILTYRSLTERARVIAEIQALTAGQCAFYYDLGTAPISPEQQGSPLGAKIIVDSRVAVHNGGCRQHLPPPSLALQQLAGKYHINVPY